jgi:ATP synthase F1 delta subunit
VKKHKNAKKFAKMFLSAVGLDEAPRALEELAAAAALVEKSPEFRSLLVNPAFGAEERAQAVGAVGRHAGFSDATVKFLGFLAAAQAAQAVGDVLEKAAAIYAEKKARVKATVITPAPVGGEYESRLRDSLARMTDREVDIHYATDPSLLGGMLVKVGSRMFDSSLQGQLRLLREELIKG